MLGWNGKITWFKSAEVARQAANDFINGKDGWVLIATAAETANTSR